ncbi:MAG TPA: phosphodiester glycosidase family protein, partial [Gaiellaceae bacterium]|nr:phosphodiester glycosidase family protein [Gaiellaceae bacterium]
MLAKLLIAAALAGFVVSSASGATSTRGAAQQAGETSSLLMPGVSYLRQVDFTPRGPVVLDVVIAPRPDGSLYTLAPVLSNGTLVGTERLTDVEQRLSTAATVVGVNGDFFRANPGSPSGILIQGGALESPPATNRSSLAIGADGTLSVATVSFDGSWRGTDQRRALDLNRPRVKGHTTLYTPAWGAATPKEKGVVEDVIGSFPAATPNTLLNGVVTSVAAAGGTPIPPGGAVLVARGAQAPHLSSEAPAGTTVEVRLTLTPSWGGVPSAIGGGPLLVTDGRPVFNAKESFSATILNQRNARSAIGQLSDGRILLVTVEGGNPAYSVGMTNYELGVALVRLGARTAMGLGTGGSASLSF